MSLSSFFVMMVFAVAINFLIYLPLMIRLWLARRANHRAHQQYLKTRAETERSEAQIEQCGRNHG